MKNINAKELLQKYKENKCTEAELALLESWYLEKEIAAVDFTLDDLKEVKNQVWAKLPVHTRQNKTIWLWTSYSKIAIAAMLFVCLSFSLYFFISTNNNAVKTNQSFAKILPGGKKATLTLANGTSISLNDIKTGQITDQGGSNIIKTVDGQLIYNNNNDNLIAQLNLLTIPNGGYYNITLEDGTKVWLNSASSLKYPTTFEGIERIVELTGEAYFEVAHRANQPFKVIANNQTVQVLGTHFNINAYPNENSVATTLTQGSVKITSKNGISKLLKPGHQANVIDDYITIKSVNTDDALAWRYNDFVFNNEDLGSIMRKISRWYDVEVTCPDSLAKMVFTGSVSRLKNINQVLKIMELTQSVHFKIEGRRITVMP